MRTKKCPKCKYFRSKSSFFSNANGRKVSTCSFCRKVKTQEPTTELQWEDFLVRGAIHPVTKVGQLNA